MGGETEGDLLRIVTDFTFKRSDYKVGEGLSAALVSDEVHVRLSVIGTALDGKWVGFRQF